VGCGLWGLFVTSRKADGARAARAGVVSLLIGGTALGCGSSPSAPSTSDLRQASESVAVGGKTLRLTTEIWRDFMPISPPDGKPMVARLVVSTLDGSPFPSGVSVERTWLFFGNQTWETADLQPEFQQPGAASLAVVAREGPKWGPGVSVDVVVRLRDSQGVYLLQARGQPITATY
jgi:hypothetical protein